MHKSAFYSCGMIDGEVQRKFVASGLLISMMPSIPWRPICSKKISKAQCEILIEKMTAKLRCKVPTIYLIQLDHNSSTMC